MNLPANLFTDSAARHFWLWVDPSDMVTHHNMNIVGSFCSTPQSASSENLMFILNPTFQGIISPFQSNLMRNYVVDYNLELARRDRFPHYPCRLQAIFLLESEDDGLIYQSKNPKHVEGRTLTRGTTNGAYCFSQHDSAWVNFLRLPHMMSQEDINKCTNAYWLGRSVQDAQLCSCGKPWTQDRATEILFLGRLDFERPLNA
jgi:hypothetical protein